ncbi:hypothetical protein AVEN_23154-1 [Araneus ventricosus]|uniref:Reverse transcriptase domain-containing protein n=1 Tax=Araneus ventricosus TaxID=182803 RepID=A0A4Y2FGG6_ARAVE|nr:hypothetical protein AVEN_23154-1 [Araneus ventricosus]
MGRITPESGSSLDISNNIYEYITNAFLDDFSNLIVLKGGKDQQLASSYRPISLLPTIGKVLEKLMTQRLTYHLESTNSLNDRQHGFRDDKSVDTAINELLSKRWQTCLSALY